MKTLAALGVAGGFVLVTKKALLLAGIWAVAKVSPVLGVALFSALLLLERWL
jgi:uncharacterized membrane protein